jgi:murein DD-endopeptidase MepM/ murein hydrolase activator NlpD
MLETKKLKVALGGFMSFMGVSFSSVWLVAGVYQGSRPVQAFSPPGIQAVIETEKQEYFYDFKKVIPTMTGVSQGFGRWHNGVDITAQAGSNIYPVQAGKVVRIENTRWDYGRSVLIDHGNGLTSLYAHLGKVMVEEGEQVGPDTVLAEIGLTGRTTGYHLHLEIRDKDRVVSPSRFLVK